MAAKRQAKAGGPGAGAGLLTMDQAVARLKTSRATFYRWLRGGQLRGLKVGRQWRFEPGEVERFLKGEEPRIGLAADISPLLEALAARLPRGAAEAPDAPTEPVARAVWLMLRVGWALRASDLHLEPDAEPGGRVARLRYRVDGVLHPVARCDLRLLPALVEQWKRMAACDVNERGLPQDGRYIVQEGGRSVDVRVCFVPACLGESLTARFLPDAAQALLTLDRIPYAPRDRERLMRNLDQPWGVLLFTGPVGSGKTTVLYACLNHLVRPGKKLLSAEDPVEYLLPGVTQAQVNARTGLTFPRLLRSFLRSDPDVIMVGEVRDRETLEVALQAALTGHLVLTTLHTDDAAGALQRMVDIGAPPFLVADAVRLVTAQRLVRRLCEACCVPAKPAAVPLVALREQARQGGLQDAAGTGGFRDKAGCARCGQTGFRGRTVVSEMLEVTPEVGAALRRGERAAGLRELAVRGGMTTLLADGFRRAAAGETTVEELRSLPRPGGAAGPAAGGSGGVAR